MAAVTTTASAASAVTTTMASTAATTGPAPASSTVTAAIAFRPGGRSSRGIYTVEVGFIAFVEIGAAFEGQACASNGRADGDRFHRRSFL